MAPNVAGWLELNAGGRCNRRRIKKEPTLRQPAPRARWIRSHDRTMWPSQPRNGCPRHLRVDFCGVGLNATRCVMDNAHIAPVCDPDIELSLLLRDAMAGDGHAACKLGNMYRVGKQLKYSPRLAHRWYARSALAGYAAGQSNLGACLERGLGCRINYRQAAKWYALSASQGHPTAQFNLGLCHLNGRGVPQNLAEACRWFQKAADHGAPDAADALSETRAEILGR